MSIRFRAFSSLCVLSLATLLFGCDPKGAGAAQGAIGVQPSSLDGGGIKADNTMPARPGPDTGITPTLPPTVDPLHDPSPDLQPTKLPGGIDVGDAPVPWKLQNPAAGSGCKCKLVCGPANDDRSKDCITMCEGTGC